MTAHLIVFARNPVPGSVKTRLQTRHTPEEAAVIYRGFILDTLAGAESCHADRHVLAVEPADAVDAFADLAGDAWDIVPQAAGDLGLRMDAAFRHEASRGADRAVLIGTDIPSLPAAHLRRAFELLAEREVVLGPSTDGGYYLVGLRQPRPDLFEEMEWSAPAIFARTVERARASGSSIGLVPPWYDVDTPEDLDFLLAHADALEQAGERPRLQHTRQGLDSLPGGRL